MNYKLSRNGIASRTRGRAYSAEAAGNSAGAPRRSGLTEPLMGIGLVDAQLVPDRRLRCCTLIDECTREYLTRAVARSLRCVAVISALESASGTRRTPVRLFLDHWCELGSHGFNA